jgi:hypothetical protein
MREDWRNGQENKNLVEGPEPDRGNDGYYYYDDDANMARITSPAFAIFSDRGALVDAQEIIRDLYGKKTPDSLDEWHQIPNTAHADVVCGYATSNVAYPLIGEWLASLSARESAGVDAGVIEDVPIDSGDTDVSSKDDASRGIENSALLSRPGSSGLGCGSAANAATEQGGTSASSCLDLLIMCAMLFSVLQLGRRKQGRRLSGSIR